MAPHTTAHADEWSVVPTGDPIYRQLNIIDQFGDGKTTKGSKGLTRYEAALQVARTITFSGNDAAALPHTSWRALLELSQSLRPELTRLGIDVEATIATCEKNLATPREKTEKAALSAASAGAPRQLRPQTGSLFADISGARSPLLGSAGVPQQDAALGLTRSAFKLSLSRRLRMEAVALMSEGDRTDPFATSYTTRSLASSAGVAYEFSPWLRLSAGTTQRNLLGATTQTPLLGNALFQGASQAQGTRGGVDVTLGRLSLSGDVESLGTDTGKRGLLAGGGVGLSAWQNRLSMSARLSVLMPEERSQLASTGTELGLGVDVTRRLKLNLLYQNLFTQQSVNNASRLSGGLSLSF